MRFIYMLTSYNNKSYALNLIKQNMNLFNLFNNVYLFGSILNQNKIPNDIDILLIYSAYSEQLIEDINYICNTLNQISILPIDLTVLSLEEEKELNFLKKQHLYYLKIK